MDKNIEVMLASLIKQRNALDAAIAALQGLNGITATPNGNHAPKTILEVVRGHLAKVGKPQTIAQLRDVIRQAGILATAQSIQTQISRRARRRIDILHAGRGMWALNNNHKKPHKK